MKIGCIGTGTIGSALYSKWRTEEILVTERGAKDIEGTVVAGTKELVDAADLVVIAVKPQQWPAVRATIGDLHGKRLLSVMAGVTLEQLEQTGAKAVRVMPNIAITTDQGACAYSFGLGWSGEEKRRVLPLIERLGLSVELEERQIDTFIGISGSGIAYLLDVLRIFADVAQERGMSAGEARAILGATARGAAALLDDGGDFETLIRRVASKGGSTEQGLAALKELGVEEIYRRVLERTMKRSEEMGKEYG